MMAPLGEHAIDLPTQCDNVAALGFNARFRHALQRKVLFVALNVTRLTGPDELAGEPAPNDILLFMEGEC